MISYRYRDSDSTFYIGFPSIGITFSAIFIRQSGRNKTANVFSPFVFRSSFDFKNSNQDSCLSISIQTRNKQRLSKIRILKNLYLENYHLIRLSNFTGKIRHQNGIQVKEPLVRGIFLSNTYYHGKLIPCAISQDVYKTHKNF